MKGRIMRKELLRKSILFATTSGIALAFIAMPIEFDAETHQPVLTRITQMTL